MYGNVKQYNEESKIGYISGFDDVMYFFRQRDVANNEKLKENDFVRFDYIRESMEEMPIAIKIEKKR